MRHSVPQFIDIEDKIIGPLSFRQAIYMAGGIGIAWSVFVLLSNLSSSLPFILKAIIAVPFVGIGAALAFLKMNNRPFIFYIQSFFKFQVRPKKFIWRKGHKKEGVDDRIHLSQSEKDGGPVGVNEELVPRITRSKIKDLALSLDMELDNKLSSIDINTIK